MQINIVRRARSRLALNEIGRILDRGKIITGRNRTVGINDALQFAALELEEHNFEREYKILRYLYVNEGAEIFCDVNTVAALKAAYRLIKAQLEETQESEGTETNEEQTESLKETED